MIIQQWAPVNVTGEMEMLLPHIKTLVREQLSFIGTEKNEQIQHFQVSSCPVRITSVTSLRLFS